MLIASAPALFFGPGMLRRRLDAFGKKYKVGTGTHRVGIGPAASVIGLGALLFFAGVLILATSFS